MLSRHFDYVMSKNTPLSLGGEDESNASAEPAYGTNQIRASAPATAFNNSDELRVHMGSSHQKRPIHNDQVTSQRSKQMKVSHPSTDSEIPGWGPNGHAVNVPDSGLFLGSLLANQFMPNSNTDLRSLPTGTSHTHFSSNPNSLHQAGISAFRDQFHRNEAVNALLLSNLYSPNGQRHGSIADFTFLDTVQNRQQANVALQQQVRSQLGVPNMTSLNQLNHALYGNNSTRSTQDGASSAYTSIMRGLDQGTIATEQMQYLLRQIQTTSNLQQNSQNLSTMIAENSTQMVIAQSSERPTYHLNHQNVAQRQSMLPNRTSNLDLALCIEGKIQPYTERPVFCLGISEDPNWLSEFHCFVRSDLIEVYRASHDDVTSRNNSISYQQVGLRCRFCAHLPPSSRSGRSSAFPSSLRQIYQSFTMMLRDHFSNCEAIPPSVLTDFNHLKDKPAQGATDSKRYWIYSAKKVGMMDTSDGISMTQETRYEGSNTMSFGTVAGQHWEDDAFRNESLVRPTDSGLVSDFLILLMMQVQPIRLTETECIGNRRSLQVGLPGFGCRYCCNQKRLGLCRMFPARRRTLPHKVNDLYDHLRRCTLCPQTVKDNLELRKSQMTESFRADQGSNREFYDRVWSRLGHAIVSTSSK